MNKRLFSTSVSLGLHVTLLIIAFNTILVTPSVSAPMSPKLIHIKIDSRPFSSSVGDNTIKAPEKIVVTAPEMKIPKIEKTQMKKQQNLAKKTLVAEAKRETRRSPVTRSVNTSSVMPVSKIIADQVKGMRGRAPVESMVQNYQGVEPHLAFEHDGKANDIRSFLGYELHTYEDLDDHGKYFRLSIKVEEIPGALPSIPKEIIFLIDSSNSIGPEMLEKFQKGVQKCLQQLGTGDKFNVVAFNDKMFRMQERSVPASPGNIQQASEFLSHLKANSSTDLYGMVLKSVELKDPMKPAYIFLLSDGDATTGVTDPLQIINQIGELNKGRVPIFALGAGYPNKYLMNFLSFTNHGWAEFASYLNTENGVVDMYNHIKDPVLLNLRYYSTGLDEKEIYPKLLPDLFKGAEFVLYGRYINEQTFLFQLRGDSQADVKQYVVSDNFANGTRGDRSIAQEWAMRKIYHLIGILEYNKDNAALDDEINQLAKKFDLKIPQYTVKK